MNIINKKLFALMFLALGTLNATIPAKATIYYRLSCLFTIDNKRSRSLEMLKLDEERDKFEIACNKERNACQAQFNDLVLEHNIEVPDSKIAAFHKRLEDLSQKSLKFSKDYEEQRLNILNKFVSVLRSLTIQLDACAAVPILEYDDKGIPFYIDPSYDITDRAIEMLNNQYLLECKKGVK